MNDTKRKYMQWCSDCPKAYDDTCSGADVKRCEAERKARIFNESVMKKKTYVEKEPVKIQPIVHCKDCKYAQNPNDTMVYCTYFECGTMSQDDFCSQGQRRIEND